MNARTLLSGTFTWQQKDQSAEQHDGRKGWLKLAHVIAQPNHAVFTASTCSVENLIEMNALSLAIILFKMCGRSNRILGMDFRNVEYLSQTSRELRDTDCLRYLVKGIGKDLFLQHFNRDSKDSAAFTKYHKQLVGAFTHRYWLPAVNIAYIV